MSVYPPGTPEHSDSTQQNIDYKAYLSNSDPSRSLHQNEIYNKYLRFTQQVQMQVAQDGEDCSQQTYLSEAKHRGQLSQ